MQCNAFSVYTTVCMWESTFNFYFVWRVFDDYNYSGYVMCAMLTKHSNSIRFIDIRANCCCACAYWFFAWKTLFNRFKILLHELFNHQFSCNSQHNFFNFRRNAINDMNAEKFKWKYSFKILFNDIWLKINFETNDYEIRF